MESKKELTSFMIKKTKEARGEVDVEKNEKEDAISDPPKIIKMEAGANDIRAAKAMMIFRIVLNMLFIIPLALAIVGLLGYILVKILPATIGFIKNFLVLLMTR